MTDDENFGEWLRAAAAQTRERSELASALYDRLRASGKLGSHRVLTYRCPRRCLLLDVLRLPHGFLVACPRYKLSPGVNETTSTAEGRQRHTEDGDRRWKGQVFFSTDAAGYSLNCDHVAGYHLTEEAFDRDIEGDKSVVVITPAP